MQIKEREKRWRGVPVLGIFMVKQAQAKEEESVQPSYNLINMHPPKAQDSILASLATPRQSLRHVSLSLLLPVVSPFYLPPNVTLRVIFCSLIISSHRFYFFSFLFSRQIFTHQLATVQCSCKSEHELCVAIFYFLLVYFVKTHNNIVFEDFVY